MPRSNLEIYVDILESLTVKSPQNISAIMRKSNLNSTTVNQHLDLLVTNQIVNKINHKKRVLYTITPKGTLILKTFSKIKEAFQIEEKDLNRFLF